MDRDWLAAQLAAGRSFESIAREVDLHPSTVAYWARKHGLTSAHAPRHAARGQIDRELLAEIVACRLSIRDMADVFARSPASVRHWLAKYELQTARTVRLSVGRTPLPPDAGPDVRMCPDHGPTSFVLDRDGYRRWPQVPGRFGGPPPCPDARPADRRGGRGLRDLRLR